VKLYDILKVKNTLVKYVCYVPECTVCRLGKSVSHADNIKMKLRKACEDKRRMNQA
jgi:hypothetical protein